MTDDVDIRWHLTGPAYYLWVALRVVLVLPLVWVNLNLWTLDPQDFAHDEVPPGVVDSLDAIGDDLRSGGGEAMQQLFPEGYTITHGIYGFANVDVALRSEPGSPQWEHAISEARWAKSKVDSNKGREIFSDALDPPYGAFYRGYLAWLRGGILLADAGAATAEKASFLADCEEIAAAFRAADTPYLESYPGMAWPGDSVFMAASLALHDRLFEPEYTDVLARWTADVRRLRDPSIDMIPHAAKPLTGETHISTRGLSAVLMSRMLYEVDPELALEEYRRSRENFVAARFGLIPGVLEYRRGETGRGDVDSGPLVFGMSGSASVVGVAAARLHGDREFADPGLIAMHAVGMPLFDRYVFGLLPVGEAFIAWAQTTTPWVYREGNGEATWEPLMPAGWRFGWHLFTLVVLALVFFGELRTLVRRLKRRSKSP